jgi:hypothetical protein
MADISKSDWKLFCSRITDWQEAYMEKLNHEYIELFSGEGPASKKFWELDERIKQDKKGPGVLIKLQKSSAYWDIAALVSDGAITMDDLSDFSDNLKDAVKFILSKWTA